MVDVTYPPMFLAPVVACFPAYFLFENFDGRATAQW